MLMKIYWAYLIISLCHEVTSLQPNHCEFFDEVFEYVPQTVSVQAERKERKKPGIGTVLDPRNLDPRNLDAKNLDPRKLVPDPRKLDLDPRRLDPRKLEAKNLDPRNILDPRNLRTKKTPQKNVTKTEMVAVKRMRSYIACCRGFIKVEGECVPKSSQFTSKYPPTQITSLQPSSSTMSSGLYTSASTTGKVLKISTSNSTVPTTRKEITDEAVTEDQHEEAIPTAIQLNNRNASTNNEHKIVRVETKTKVDQLVTQSFIQS